MGVFYIIQSYILEPGSYGLWVPGDGWGSSPHTDGQRFTEETGQDADLVITAVSGNLHSLR